MKTALFSLALALTATTGAFADTCTALNKNANDQLKARSANLAYYEKGWREAYAPFCSGFRIATQCNAITRLMEADGYHKDFNAQVDPQISAAIRSSSMNGKEASAFIGLVSALRSAHYNAKLQLDESNRIVGVMNAQGCAAIIATLQKSDTELLAASATGKLGKCKVVAGTNAGATIYKITVEGKDYPITGVFYPSVAEVSKALRDAVDAGTCR